MLFCAAFASFERILLQPTNATAGPGARERSTQKNAACSAENGRKRNVQVGGTNWLREEMAVHIGGTNCARDRRIIFVQTRFVPH